MERVKRITIALLALWVALGAAHTAFSFFRTGFPPNKPPAVGIGPAHVNEIAALHELLQRTQPASVHLLLPATADTATVVFFRYQLAHIAYPVRITAGRASNHISSEIPNVRALITTSSVPVPADWRLVVKQDSFVMFTRVTR